MRRIRRPNKAPAMNAPRKTAVPGSAKTLRSIIALSGVGTAATGGTFSTRLCRPRSGKSSGANFKCTFTACSPSRKMNIEDRMNGDKALMT